MLFYKYNFCGFIRPVKVHASLAYQFMNQLYQFEAWVSFDYEMFNTGTCLYKRLSYPCVSYNIEQYDIEQYNIEQYNIEQYNIEQCNIEQYNIGQYNIEQYNIEQFNIEQYNRKEIVCV